MGTNRGISCQSCNNEFNLVQEAAFVCPECDDLFGAYPDFEKHCRDDHK